MLEDNAWRRRMYSTGRKKEEKMEEQMERIVERLEESILGLPDPQVVVGSLPLLLFTTAQVGRTGVEGLEMLSGLSGLRG